MTSPTEVIATEELAMDTQAPRTITISARTLLGTAAVAGLAFLLYQSNEASAERSEEVAPQVQPTVIPLVISGEPATAQVLNVTLAEGDRLAGGSVSASGRTSGHADSVTVGGVDPHPGRTSYVPGAVTNLYEVVVDQSRHEVIGSTIVEGDGVVVAYDGSIVQVGDNGQLDANSGDVAGGGVVGIDVDGSSVETGGPETGLLDQNGTGSGSSVGTDASGASGSPVPRRAGQGRATRSASTQQDLVLGGARLPLAGRSVSISGFEDHSVTVQGDDNLVTYDDSNVFVARNGRINANTGDTDSSGLNVVDAQGSIVRSGNSGDGEGSDDDEAEDVDLVDGRLDDADVESGDDDAGDEEAASTPLRSARTSGMRAGGSALVDDEDTFTAAFGPEAFVIGGDGYDDIGVRVLGNRNIVTEDDGNVVVGGTGDVNAQIGDSDTGGAVVMGVRDSLIEGGCEGDLCPLYQRIR
jgi:hypothetical protein